jgi:signal transduction histidine kinase
LAHEIRTPLSTLEAHIDGLEDGVVAAESRTFDTMRSQVQRLQRLATDVRLAADAQEHALDLQMQRVSVWELVRAAYDEAAPLYAEKGVRLENLCGDRSPVVHVDRDRMQQVLGNLLDNALRYTPTGGLVTISCRSTRSVIEVLVTDSGEGIPAEELERVFERFHRVEPSRQNRDGGSGLGLTIARAIVVDHGGGIRAHRDEAGMGTVVVVALPRG